MNLTVERSQSRALDYLALTYPLTERLGLVDIFNRHCALAPQAANDNGIVLTAMTQSRLGPTPVPLVHMSAWAEHYAIGELYHLPNAALNDDTCGRALDALYPVLTQVWVELLGRVQAEFGLALGVVHTDVTLTQVEGDYDTSKLPTVRGQEPSRPRYGRTPKGFDSQRKQLGLSMSVTPQGLPAWWLAHDGNVSDPQVYQQHLFALRTWFQQLHPIMVGDSKLPTSDNRLAFHRAGAYYVGPASLRAEDMRTLEQLWQSGATPVPLLGPAQDAAGQVRYWGLALTEERPDPEEQTCIYLERTIFVFSRDERRTIRHARAKALWKARAALRHVQAQLHCRQYKSRDYILRQLDQRMGSGSVFILLQLEARPDETGQARFTLRWKLDHQALRRAATFDGWYRLLTNLPEAEYPMDAVLALYKGQAHAEGAFKQIKHWPIQVTPLWLHQPRRIEALLGLTAIALLLTAVLAHQLRQAMAQEPTPPTGLQPEGRDHLPVTSRRLWQIMLGLRLMVITMCEPDGSRWQLTTADTPNPAQSTVFRLLNWPQPKDYLPVGLAPAVPTQTCGKSV